MTTIFLTAERKMIHTFDNGVKITTDFNFKVSYVEKGEKSTSFSIEGLEIEDYMKTIKAYGTNSNN